MMNKLKLMTLNIGNPSEKRVKEQICWLETRKEDIFILTETKNSEGCGFLESYFSDYGNNLFNFNSSDSYYVSFPKSQTGDLGVMCISRLPIDKTYTFFPNQSAYYARLLEVDIANITKKLHIAGIYVPSRDRSEDKIKRKQGFLAKTLKYLSSIQTFPCVICGDFNILDRNHIPRYSTFMNWEYDFYDNLFKLGYQDAFNLCHPGKQEYSWVGRTNDGYRYDYCFVSKDIINEVKDCYYVHETRELGLTDHSAVILEFK